ncbi:MAG TPA: hypothetical protein VMJ31_00415 [Methylocystis sp.]|nr:hypothetical protein [Methylocystis sp.]
MRFIKFASGAVIILALTASGASAHLPAVEAAFGAGFGWQAYRTPGAYHYPLRMFAPRLGNYGTSWSSGQQEPINPHR